jgi:membrane protein implicated in regulation of membrane protease activity
MDISLDAPILGVAAGLLAGIALIGLARWSRRLADPIRGLVRLSMGDVSFTEVLGMFLIGYAVGSLVSGPPTPVGGGPPLPPGGGRFIGGPFNPFLRGGLPVTFGVALAFITVLIRSDLIGKLSTPQSHKSVSAIIGGEALVVEDIPAGGHGQITFRDPGGTLVGIMATSDVAVTRGARVRIVGVRGLNPLVVPEAEPAS